MAEELGIHEASWTALTDWKYEEMCTCECFYAIRHLLVQLCMLIGLPLPQAVASRFTLTTGQDLYIRPT